MPFEVSDLAEMDAPEKEYLWTLNFGPQHPATHTTLRLILTLDGETVINALPHIGYLHSGFEKLGEHLDFNQYVTIVDRMNYISPLANEISWHHAVEKLLGIEITPRCKYLRTILAEIMRLHDHLLNVGTTGLDLGAFTAFLYAFYQREKIYDIVESASGQRFHTSYTRVGGVMFDVNKAWVHAGPCGSASPADPQSNLHRPSQGGRVPEWRRLHQHGRHRATGSGERRVA
jgi:NADH-quinone oxidoreductase subunit D